MTLTFGSLFAGIGGFDLGFEQAGLRCAWQVEIDPACRSVLGRHWPDVPKYADVRDCGAHNLAPVDVICGGFPCQDLSVAGKRAGLDGHRSGLFFEITRIVRDMREATNGIFPNYLVLENVPGLLSSNGGRDFAVVIGELAQLGALDIAWRILDAQYFGVAQRRRRVFLVADFRGERAGEILFEPEGVRWHPAAGGKARAGVAARLTSGSATGRGVNQPGRRREDDYNLVAATLNSGGNSGGFRTEPGEHLIPTVSVKWAKGTGGPAGDECQNLVAYNIIGLGQQGRNHAYEAQITGTIQHKGNSASGNEAGTIIAHALTAEGHDASADGTERGVPPAIQEVWRPPARQAEPAYPAAAVRRLTPKECSRLQGFPDGHTAGQADSTRYRQLGNAVAVPVARWIGQRIAEALP